MRKNNVNNIFMQREIIRNKRIMWRREKQGLAQVFFSEFCEIFKSTFLIENFWWLLLNVHRTEKSLVL